MAASIEQVDSSIFYQILTETSQTGGSIPMLLGEGRFAKVYKAWQCSDGQKICQVAIKILHSTATNSHQDLFDKEIALLQELSATGKFNGVSILDVVHLGPMIMCGCGKVYHPFCPKCGKHQLQRRESDDKEYPLLACPGNGCDYQVSANDIEMQLRRLTSFPAKQCCKEGARATEGTIINFIDRPAVIMELQQFRLDEVGSHRRNYFDQRTQPFLSLEQVSKGRFSLAKRRQEQDRDRLQRAKALDKMMLMVQLAEAVAWLHQEMNIVHKDLTPDNVMVNFGKERAGSERRQTREPVRLQNLLNDLITYPNFGLTIIDFGLADRGKLSHKWYEERDVNNAGVDKAPYFSPEALQRIQHLPPRVQIDVLQKRFLIPPEVWASNLTVHEGDLLTFQWDKNHFHDCAISRIEQGLEPGVRYAYFEGTPPPEGQHRQAQLILPLVEAHDIYSVGALFYYIMTEDHQQVQRLSGLVNAIQTRPCELTAKALKSRHGDGYIAYRDAIPIPDPYWRDRVMEIILRAMVRGRPESYSASRSQRGPLAALALLWEAKGVYRGLQEKILSESRVRRSQMATVGLVGGTLILTALVAGRPSHVPTPPPVACPAPKECPTCPNADEICPKPPDMLAPTPPKPKPRLNPRPPGAPPMFPGKP